MLDKIVERRKEYEELPGKVKFNHDNDSQLCIAVKQSRVM